MLQSTNQRMLSLLILLVLTLTNYMEVKGVDTSDFTFNADVRYSQWVTKSRMNDYWANTTHDGFAVYNVEGTKITSRRSGGKSELDYVPGLVAKAIIENVQYYSQYPWAQSWSLPFFYSIADYGNAFYNKYKSTYGSLDDLNAAKVYFGLYELTNTGAYASNNVVTSASTTKAHAQEALRRAMEGENGNEGIIKHNSDRRIENNTPAYLAGHTIVEGGWWHKTAYANEMWLDGSYMGPALFAQLHNYNGSDIIGDDWTIVYRQIQALWEMCWNSTDKLLYHAFSAKSKDNYSATWAGFDPDNGVFHSASYWGRACGWYFLALIDILEQMDKAGLSNTTNYATLKSHLSDLAAGLAARQDATTGCWYQILDEDGTFHSSIYNNGKNASNHSDTYNYIESSASALFTAGYLKAIRKGYLSGSTVPAGCSNNYETIAKNGYQGLVNNFFAADGNEGVHLFGSCRSAGLGGAAVNGDKWRDGSKAYYLLGHDVARVAKDESVTEGKILGAFIFAATEYERLYQNNTVLFEKDLAHTYDLKAGDEITCPASGSGANITYQWYKDGVAVEGETNATIAPTASGAYYCKATSGTTTIQSSTTNVTVPGVDTETPVFTTDLAATATATVGTAKTLTVAASHADGYQWYSNTTASNTSGTEIENATSASYTFTPNATGTLYYYCVATNSKATGIQSVASNVCTVTVSEAPAETTYTVTFNATTNGGTCATASITQASSGASITLPAATKDGNTFNGWYTASTGGTLRGTSGASYTPTADETLYAQFTPAGGGDDIVWDFSNLSAQDFTSNSSYSFNATDGTTEMRYTAGSSDQVVAKSGTTSGYLKENGKTGGASAKDTDGTTNIGKTRLIRLFVTGTGTLTINCNGTNGEYKVYDSNVANTAALSSTALISSLSANTESSEITVTNGLWIETTTKGYITSIVWSPSGGGSSTYTVSYNMNGHGDAIANTTGVTALPNPLPSPTATGYTFAGWYTDSGLTSAAVAGASIDADTPLYAKWTLNAPTFSPTTGNTINPTDNVTISGIASSYVYTAWGASAIDAATLTVEGNKKTYNGSGNFTATASGTGTRVLSARAYDGTLYSDVATATYTIRTANTLALSTASGSVEMGNTLDISGYVTDKNNTSTTVTYTSNNTGVATVSAAGVITPVAVGSTTITVAQEQNATYTAGEATFTVTVTSASPTTYTVSYNMNGHGEAIADVTNVTALPNPLPSPEATGYIFGGWYTDSGLNNAATAGASISADTELYAKWTEEHTVKFYNGETQFGETQEIEEGNTVSAPTTNPTKDGYTFKGWTTTEGGTLRVVFPYPVYSNVNFYAVWSNTTSGGGGEENETIFSAAGAGSSNLSVPGNTTNQEITSTNATITGGEMYATNKQTSAKDMMKSQGDKYAFLMPNDNTYFKITLNKALQAGDKINTKIYERDDASIGLWFSTDNTNNTKPSTEPTSKILRPVATSSGWGAEQTYTVATGDGICGESTFYIYRAYGKNTYFTDFTITREGQGDEITLETVSDYEDFESYAGENKTVTFKRNFNNGKWTTLVLPFSATTAQVVAAFEYPNDCEFANIKSMTVNDQGTGSIRYVTTSHITANTPILAKIKPNDGLSGKEGFTADEYVFSGVTVVAPTSVVSTSTDGKVEMHGVYKTTGYTQISSDSYFLSGGKFYDWSYLNAMSPFSAYILPVGANTQSIKSISFAEEATGIVNVNGNGNGNANGNESYNLAGQKVGKDYSGIVIIKGKKVFKR